MGVPGQFKKPSLTAGRLRDLNDALHALHLIAGQPSLDTMHRLLGKRISRTRLHDAFTEPRLPPWDTVDALVEVLATRAPGTTPQEVLPEIHALWILASQQRSLLNPLLRTITDEITATFALYLEVRPGELPPDVPTVELAVDSLVILEVLGSLERVYNLTFSEEEVMTADVLTIEDLARMTLAAQQRAHGDENGPPRP